MIKEEGSRTVKPSLLSRPAGGIDQESEEDDEQSNGKNDQECPVPGEILDEEPPDGRSCCDADRYGDRDSAHCHPEHLTGEGGDAVEGCGSRDHGYARPLNDTRCQEYPKIRGESAEERTCGEYPHTTDEDEPDASLFCIFPKTRISPAIIRR